MWEGRVLHVEMPRDTQVQLGQGRGPETAWALGTYGAIRAPRRGPWHLGAGMTPSDSCGRPGFDTGSAWPVFLGNLFGSEATLSSPGTYYVPGWAPGGGLRWERRQARLASGALPFL